MKPKLKSIIMGVIAIAVAEFGISLQATSAEPNNYTLANLNALKNRSSNVECPSIYDLPHAYLKAEVKQYNNINCTFDGFLSPEDGVHVSGSFNRGGQYSVLVELKDCKHVEEDVCCQVSEQGAKLLIIE